MKIKSISYLLLISVSFFTTLSGLAFGAEQDVNIQSTGLSKYAQVMINGNSAAAIFEKMLSKVKTTQERVGHSGAFFVSTKKGKNIICTFSPEAQLTYRCTFYVDTKGAVVRDIGVTAGTAHDNAIHMGETEIDTAKGGYLVSLMSDAGSATVQGASNYFMNHMKDAKNTNPGIVGGRNIAGKQISCASVVVPSEPTTCSFVITPKGQIKNNR